jgi:hypothetical protein
MVMVVAVMVAVVAVMAVVVVLTVVAAVMLVVSVNEQEKDCILLASGRQIGLIF